MGTQHTTNIDMHTYLCCNANTIISNMLLMTGEPGSSTRVSHDDGLLSIVNGTIVLVSHPANCNKDT